MKDKDTENACAEFEELLETYLTGGLELEKAERVAEHLAKCAPCRDALEEARLSGKLIRLAFEPAEEPGPAFTRLTMAKVRAAAKGQSEQTRFWHPLEALALRLVFSAAIAVALLFAYSMRTNSLAYPPATVTVASSARDIFPDLAAQPASGDEVLMAIAEREHGNK